MKTIMILLIVSSVSILIHAQTIVGSWQLVNETKCIEDEMKTETDSIQALMKDMKGMSSAAPRVITFKDNNTGEESTHIIFKRKASNAKSFLYKSDGSNLYLLDKKSRTITDTYIIDKLEGDSLILSNSARPCDTMVFVKIK